MRTMPLAVFFIVNSCFSAAAPAPGAQAPGGDKPNPALKALDSLFADAESLEGALEQCIGEKMKTISAAGKGTLALQQFPEPSTGSFQFTSEAVATEQQKKRDAGLRAVPACRSRFSMNLQDKALLKFFSAGDNELLAYHQACLALARGNPAVCGELKQAGLEEVAGECRLNYYSWAILRAVAAGDPQASRLCLEAAAAPGEKAVSAPQSCAKLLRREIPGACLKAVDLYMDQHECIIAFGLSNKANACAVFDSFRTARDERACRDFSAYAKAHSGRDPGLCGDRLLCRMLMAQGSAGCDVIAATIRDKFCLHASAVEPTAAATTFEEAQKQRGHQKKVAELARQQEREVLDQKRRRLRDMAATMAETRRAESFNRVSQVNETCQKIAKDIQVRLDNIYALLGAFQPKGHPGHKSRSEKFLQVQARQAQRIKKLQAVKPP